jgi:hypothetical protein
MEIKSVTVGYSKLVSRGNFENEKMSCELSANIDSSREDMTTVRNTLEKMCREYVESRLAGNEMVFVDKDTAEKIRTLSNLLKSKEFEDLPF